MSEEWDAIVVGTGLGGAIAGARLAEAGMRVLFLERGGASAPGGPARLDQLEAEVALDGAPPRRVPTTVSGVGGTSVIYAAALERPERHDLEATEGLAHPTGGWPVGYDAFAPYFARIERMLSVCGDADPLGEADDATALPVPPPLSPGDEAIAAGLLGRGYHPYRSHVGIRFSPGCRECIGTECATGCKPDMRGLLATAALSHRIRVLPAHTVTRLEADAARVTRVIARDAGGAEATFAAPRILLAPGALATPQLLLGSAGPDWPDGLGNRSGQVGRNLMFHLSERLALWPQGGARLGFPAKSLSLRDLYSKGPQRFGLVQSMGLQAGYGNVLMHLRQHFDARAPAALRPLRPLLRLPARAASLLLGNARIFVAILEDLPLAGNRVLAGADPADPPRVAYAIPPELTARRHALRAALREMLRGERWFFLNTEPEVNYSHACGTARFGTDPGTSVLDASCRVHGLANLWITDASFMPTSTGVNPGLLIAANSLRVAEAILGAEA